MGKAKSTLVLQIGGVVLGGTLMAIGIFHGELTEIMRKAVIVCLECIGIG